VKPAQGVRSPIFIRFFSLNPNIFSIFSFKTLFLQFLICRWLWSSCFTLQSLLAGDLKYLLSCGLLECLILVALLFITFFQLYTVIDPSVQAHRKLCLFCYGKYLRKKVLQKPYFNPKNIRFWCPLRIFCSTYWHFRECVQYLNVLSSFKNRYIQALTVLCKKKMKSSV